MMVFGIGSLVSRRIKKLDALKERSIALENGGRGSASFYDGTPPELLDLQVEIYELTRELETHSSGRNSNV